MTAPLLAIASTALHLAALGTAYRAGARCQDGNITLRAVAAHVILIVFLMGGAIMSARHLWEITYM